MLRTSFFLLLLIACPFARCGALPFNSIHARMTGVMTHSSTPMLRHSTDSVNLITVHVVAATKNGKPAVHCRIVISPDSHVRAADSSGNLIIQIARGQNISIRAVDKRFTQVSLDTVFANTQRIVLALRLIPVDVSFDQPIVRPILFEFDRSALSPEFHAYLDRIASYATSRKMRIVISGFTDSFGNRVYNLRLSHRRAFRVAAYLQGKGVSVHHITVIDMGAANPVKPNVIGDDDNPEGRKANRRVELRLER